LRIATCLGIDFVGKLPIDFLDCGCVGHTITSIVLDNFTAVPERWQPQKSSFDNTMPWPGFNAMTWMQVWFQARKKGRIVYFDFSGNSPKVVDTGWTSGDLTLEGDPPAV
jgi:hypothetical protein